MFLDNKIKEVEKLIKYDFVVKLFKDDKKILDRKAVIRASNFYQACEEAEGLFKNIIEEIKSLGISPNISNWFLKIRK